MNDLIVLPHPPYCILAEIVSDEVQILRKLNIPPESKNIVLDNGLIVSLAIKHPMLRIFNQEGKMLYRQNVGDYMCLNHKNNVVYLGGSHNFVNDGSEMFSILDLSGENYQVIEKEIPVKTVPGKSIDDILILDNSLILVDNVVFPKYIFVYDIGVPANPVHLKTIRLPDNGSYEHIIKGDINDNWLILFSSTSGMGGSSQYITIDGSNNSGQLSTHSVYHFGFLQRNRYVDGQIEQVPESEMASVERPLYQFKDICLVENNLFIIRTDGLFKLDLFSEICSENMIPIKTSINDIRKFHKTSSGQIILRGDVPGEFEVMQLPTL